MLTPYHKRVIFLMSFTLLSKQLVIFNSKLRAPPLRRKGVLRKGTLNMFESSTLLILLLINIIILIFLYLFINKRIVQA